MRTIPPALRLTAAAAAFLATFLLLQPQQEAAVDAEALCPDCNIVLISVDTLRADHVGAYGYDVPTTPNIDALAEKSVLFENAISQAAWTLPAHGSMFSGLYPDRLGVVHYPASRRLPIGNPVLAETLSRKGYATGAFTGGGFVSSHYGFGRGFDIYSTNGRYFQHNMEQALAWLSINKGRRFFLFLHGYNAHRPYASTPLDKTAVGMTPNTPVDPQKFCMPSNREHPGEAGLRDIVGYYDAAIHQGDREIGRLLRALKAHGVADKTVVLLTSDHGEEFFEHGNCDHVRFVYRESVHVPYILKVPGHRSGGRRVAGLIPATISIARTLLDIVGVEHAVPGVTLVPILENKQEGFPVVYSVASATAGRLGSRGATRGITKRDTKLISYPDEGTDEAYDLTVDPNETSILPPGHDAYRMQATLTAWHDSLVEMPRPPRRPGDEKFEKAAREAVARKKNRAGQVDVPGGTSAQQGPGVGDQPQAADSSPGAGDIANGEAEDGEEDGGGGADEAADQVKGRQSEPPATDAEDDSLRELPSELLESLRELGYVE